MLMSNNPMTPPRTKEAGRHVESVLKALDILDCFHVQSSQNLKQIIEKTGLNRSRVIRLTGTLESRGYLTYDSRSRQFQLGSRVMTLGKIFELNNNLITLSRPVLKDLVQKAYDGSFGSLVMQALSSQTSSPGELAEIRRLLDDLEEGAK